MLRLFTMLLLIRGARLCVANTEKEYPSPDSWKSRRVCITGVHSNEMYVQVFWYFLFKCVFLLWQVLHNAWRLLSISRPFHRHSLLWSICSLRLDLHLAIISFFLYNRHAEHMLLLRSLTLLLTAGSNESLRLIDFFVKYAILYNFSWLWELRSILNG